MGLKDLFASNALVKLLLGDKSRLELIVTMTGVKMGDRLLVLDRGDGTLLAALAARTGLSGRACAVHDQPQQLARFGRAAARAGVLVELEEAPFATLPFGDGEFDVVVTHTEDEPIAADDRYLDEVLRVLRPGGRCLSIVRARPMEDAGTPHATQIAALQAHGFRAVRQLVAIEGLDFIEAVKGH